MNIYNFGNIFTWTVLRNMAYRKDNLDFNKTAVPDHVEDFYIVKRHTHNMETK